MNLLKPKEACRILGVCRNTLLRMIEDRQVDAVDIRRPGGKYAIYRIKADSLQNPVDPADKIVMLDIERGLAL
jgi:excisionase family DNA binding protein